MRRESLMAVRIRNEAARVTMGLDFMETTRCRWATCGPSGDTSTGDLKPFAARPWGSLFGEADGAGFCSSDGDENGRAWRLGVDKPRGQPPGAFFLVGVCRGLLATSAGSIAQGARPHEGARQLNIIGG